MRKNIIIFSSGILTGGLMIAFLLYCMNLFIISDNQTFLDTIINVLATVLTAVLSAFVAFMVAHFQIQKEKKQQVEKDYKRNLRYLSILLYENKINKYNVERAIESQAKINPLMLHSNLDNIIMIESWKEIYLEIEISNDTFNKISNLYRDIRKVKAIPKENFKVSQLNELKGPMTETINVINSDIKKIKTKLTDLN